MTRGNVRGWGLVAIAAGVLLLGSVGMRPGTAHAANATFSTYGAGAAAARFGPNVQTVNVGDFISFTWLSSGANGHNATAITGGFPTIAITQAATSGTWRPTTPGTYYFYCSLHSAAASATEEHVVANDAMVGKLIVVASGAPAPTPALTIAPAAAATPAAAPAAAPAAGTPAPAKTGSAGLVNARSASTGLVLVAAAIALLTVTGARLVTRRR